MGEDISAGATAYPSRQPVQLYVLDNPEIVIVRSRIPGHVAIMTDYNQALSVAEALRRGRALDGEGVYWIEEPIRHDDYRGSARLARELATPVQIG